MIEERPQLWRECFFGGESPLNLVLRELDDRPAVYCFCLSFNALSQCHNVELWFERLEEMISLTHGIGIQIPMGFYETLRMEYKTSSKPTYLTRETAEACLNRNSDFLSSVNYFLDIFQKVAPPLYVGETKHLYTRVNSHFNGAEDSLLSEFKRSAIKENNLMLRYCYVDDPKNMLDEMEEADEEDVSESDELALLSRSFGGVASEPEPLEKKERLFVEELGSYLLKPRFARKVGGVSFSDLKIRPVESKK